MSSEKADISKIDVLGPRIQFLTPLSGNDENYCLVTGAVPAGVVVPLHSHAERETFYVLGGERIARACLALAMYSMCLAVSSTVGETYPARPCITLRSPYAVGSVFSRYWPSGDDGQPKCAWSGGFPAPTRDRAHIWLLPLAAGLNETLNPFHRRDSRGRNVGAFTVRVYRSKVYRFRGPT
jgi:hypothetical protein